MGQLFPGSTNPSIDSMQSVLDKAQTAPGAIKSALKALLLGQNMGQGIFTQKRGVSEGARICRLHLFFGRVCGWIITSRAGQDLLTLLTSRPKPEPPWGQDSGYSLKK